MKDNQKDPKGQGTQKDRTTSTIRNDVNKTSAPAKKTPQDNTEEEETITGRQKEQYRPEKTDRKDTPHNTKR